MVRKRPSKKTKAKPVVAAPTDRLQVLIDEYLDWIAVHNYSADTVDTRRAYLRYFHDWSIDRGLDNPVEITRPVLERYQRWLFHYRKKSGQPLGVRTQHTRLQSIKSFFQWLARQNYLLHNPASEIILPHMDNRLPKYVLNVEEAERIIAQPEITTPEGLRDRAILETFYATGMRRMELATLRLYDIDADRGTVTIRQGKGRKDRIIPIGERAVAWVDKYVQEARLEILTGFDDGTIFLNYLGAPFERLQLTSMVRAYLEKSKIGKTGGCHLFRHTAATLMLENGADIRVIQQMLGHVKLDTTELYTRVSINLLKQVYLATHPAAHLYRSETPAAERNPEAEAELFAALAEEATEDEDA
jgi:integrase/recombinase XerD